MVNSIKHSLLIVWGTVEIILFAGCIYGWASLVYVLKAEGYFSGGCQSQNASTSFNGIRRYSAPLDLSIKQDINKTFKPINSLNNTESFPSTGSCKTQDESFTLVFSLATCLNGISVFFNGFIFDRYGLRVVRSIGICTYISATLMMTFSSPVTSFLLYPAIVFLAYGGYILLMTNFQLANLVPSKKSTIICLYSGSFDASAFVFVLIKITYEGGIPVNYSFMLMTVCFSICVISTFCFLPRMHIPSPLPPNYNLELRPKCLFKKCNQKNTVKVTGASDILRVSYSVSKESHPSNRVHSTVENTLLEQKDCVEGDISETNENELNKFCSDEEKESPKMPNKRRKSDKKVTSFKKCICSGLFFWATLWFTFHGFRCFSFIGHLNLLLTVLSNGDLNKVSHYTSVFAYTQFFGIFLAPICGRLMDRKQLFKRKVSNLRLDKLEASIPPFILVVSMGLLLSITAAIPVLQLQYVSFVLHVIHRAFLFGGFPAFIAQTFPSEHFGKLLGLALLILSVFSLLQYPAFLLIQGVLENNPLVVNCVIICLMLLTFGFPIYIYVYCKQQWKNTLSKENNPHES